MSVMEGSSLRRNAISNHKKEKKNLRLLNALYSLTSSVSHKNHRYIVDVPCVVVSVMELCNCCGYDIIINTKQTLSKKKF